MESSGKRGPIICITYTNHALDQFLEGLIEHFPTLARIGSRSKSTNEKLLSRNLSELRRRVRYNSQKKEIESQLEQLSSEIRAIKEMQTNNEESLYKTFVKHFPKFISKLKKDFPNDLYRGKSEVTDPKDMFRIWINGFDQSRRGQIKKAEHERQHNQFQLLQEENHIVDPEGQQQEPINEDHHEPLPFEDETTSDTSSELEDEVLAINRELNDEEMMQLYRDEDMDLLEAEFVTHHEDEYDLGINIEFLLQELMQHPNLFSIGITKRRRYMDTMSHIVKEQTTAKFIELATMRKELERHREEIMIENDYHTLANCPLIGLTSTSAAMNRKLLKRLRAPVYIIEEAAELLEGQITSVLHRHVQHLIMIGDEKQLRPKVDAYYLEAHCNLGISLFERLVMNNLGRSSLTIQQRMRPEVRKLVDMFYNRLKDHPKVKEYGDIEGVGMNVCFIAHNKLESQSEDVQSKSNEHEACFLSKFTKYLINVHQFNPTHITILTPYRGQQILIKRKLMSLLDETSYKKVRVSTIDDYQGEENEIILLSLVRSNNDNQIGFVSIQNRIIVSLSRAKRGLYVIGNESLLRNSNDWQTVLSRMDEKKQVCDHLPLCCPRHSEKKEKIVNPDDFDGVIWGGCRDACDFKFDCGHLCPLSCHHPDVHKTLKCQKNCDKVIDTCGHKCKSKCHHNKPCPPCTAVIPYHFTDCKHTMQIQCRNKNVAQLCKEECGKELPCHHICKVRIF